jgi:UPF0755 protein
MEENAGGPLEEQKIETCHKFIFFKKYKVLIITAIIAIIVVIFLIFSWSAPSNFPAGMIYDLKEGQTLTIVSSNFLKDDIVRSDFWFKPFVYIFSFGKSTLIEGNYLLNDKQNVIKLAWRVSHGELDIVPIKITLPEGMNSSEIATIFSNKFPAFNKEIFLSLVKSENLEGYLFPDTYFFTPDMTEQKIIKIMNDNFNEKIKNVSVDIKKFGKSESDVIKMASILEEEGRTIPTKEIIAGILWKRITIGMPLQIDSSFKYINGKVTATLTADDLKIASPYNLYINKGLPPTPISNPGLEAIKDAINPTKTPYLYFLTDKDGNMHYATTFAEHVANKQKYLNN